MSYQNNVPTLIPFYTYNFHLMMYLQYWHKLKW